MYVAIRRYQVESKVADEVTRHIRVGFIPLINQDPGFIGYYWLKLADSTYASISIYKDKAGAEESTKKAGHYVKQHLESLVPKPPEVWSGEVLEYEVADGEALET
jgi:hypothetical protein